MARKRGQREGHLYKKGPSWILRWREDVRTASGELQRGRFARTVGAATGPGKLTRKEAEREAWGQVLEKLDRVTIHPQSLATVQERFLNSVPHSGRTDQHKELLCPLLLISREKELNVFVQPLCLLDWEQAFEPSTNELEKKK